MATMDAQGRCTAAACACARFESQLYRPALCLSCFHNIGAHFPGEWVETVDSADKRVYFVCRSTQEKLYARPADASSALTSTRIGLTSAAAHGGQNDAIAGALVAPAVARLNATGAPASSGPASGAPAPAPAPVAAVPMLAPDAPTAVPDAVLSALSLNVHALAQALSGVPPPDAAAAAPPVLPVPAASTMHMISPAHLPPSADAAQSVTVEVDAAAAADADAQQGQADAPVAAVPVAAVEVAPVRDEGAGVMVDGAAPVVEAELPRPAPIDTAPAPPSGPAPSATAAAIVAMHLAPIFSDPLTVNLAEIGVTNDPSSGVVVLPMRQPYEENVELHRYLVITPFTIIAISAHPTRLGIGVLKWERSILSLRSVMMQPLYASGGKRGNKFAVMPSTGAPAPAPPARTGGGIASFFWRPRTASAADTPAAAPVPASVTDEEEVGFGVLVSFAPESTDTAAMLRTYRAGRRPVLREGWLVKKKQGSWRERAPLGNLAWKQRYFLLNATELAYFSGVPGQKGAVQKGVISLTGWVEVVRAGVDGSPSNARPHSFVVRTGKSFHTFQAESQAEADAWVEAISINAQHCGATSHEPQVLIVTAAADAVRIATALRSKYMDLTNAMEPAARTAAQGLLTVDLDARAASTFDMDMLAATGVNIESDDDAEMAAAKAASLGLDVGGMHMHAPVVDLDTRDDASGMSVRDALALAEASGGLSEDFLGQLPPSLADAVRAYTARGALPAPPLMPPHVGPGATSVAVMTPAGKMIMTPTAAPITPSSYDASVGWVYLDDSDVPQGPFVEPAMRAWLLAGYLKEFTLVRFAAVVPSLDVSCGVDADSVPLVFLPIATLFPDIATSAFTGGNDWVARYASATRYQALVTSAIQLGLDRALVVQQVQAMKEADMPPDLSLLMDLCGVRELPGPATSVPSRV